MNNDNKFKVGSFWAGIVIVFGTHIYMLGFGLPASQMTAHAILNLVAGALLSYAWY